MKQKLKAPKKKSDYETLVFAIANSIAIQGSAYCGIGLEALDISIMSEEEQIKHNWLLDNIETSEIDKKRFSQSYLRLSEIYDTLYKLL